MEARPIGLGCMRLSTLPERDDATSRAVLAAAIEAGVDLLDTADAYALDDTEIGHNERLIGEAVRASGRRVQIVTKGGLTRPDGAWVPNGRARHLAAAARASRERLGVDAIDLYLLHAIDPKTALATSVRALAKLRDEGVVRAIGISNVTRTQLEEALALAPIAAVEVELHPWKLDAIRGGLVELCAARGIRVLAHRPLGGPAGAKRAARDPEIAAISTRLGATPAEVVLAWLRSLSPAIVPLPGVTRVETAVSAARAATLELDRAACDALAARFLVVGDSAITASANRPAGELVMIVGMPASGKSSLAADYVARGYTRLNRDERGGSLLDLARELDRTLAAGADRVVVDNTYGSRASRAPVIDIARRHNVSVRCIAMATPIEDAQANAVTRMLARHGRLLEPAELSRRGEIAPNTQFRFRRDYEPPQLDEGFAALEEVRAPRSTTGTRRALIVELDEVVWRGRPRTPAEIEILPGAAGIAAWSAHVLAGTTWQLGITADERALLAAAIAERLGVAIEVLACAHPAGPPICWCRKPLPGLALDFAHRNDVDLARSLHVGRGAADRGFALRAGVRYADIADGWPLPD